MPATETPALTSSKLDSERGVLASYCNKATPGYAHGSATGTQATAASFRSGAPSTKQNAIEKMLLDVRDSITRSLVLESTSMEASFPGIEQRLAAAAASGLILSMASDGHRWKVSRKPSSDVNRSISFVASIKLSGDFPVMTRCILIFSLCFGLIVKSFNSHESTSGNAWHTLEHGHQADWIQMPGPNLKLASILPLPIRC